METGEQLTPEELDYLSAFGKRKGVYLNEAFIELRRDGGNHVAAPVCRAASTTLVISPSNELVLPCYHLGEQKFPIDGKLFDLYNAPETQRLAALEGRLPACEGCTINCYMQPSFAVETSKYFWQALPSTLKYNWEKGTWKRLTCEVSFSLPFHCRYSKLKLTTQPMPALILPVHGISPTIPATASWPIMPPSSAMSSLAQNAPSGSPP